MVAISKQRGDKRRCPLAVVVIAAVVVGCLLAYLEYIAQNDYIPSVIQVAILNDGNRSSAEVVKDMDQEKEEEEEKFHHIPNDYSNTPPFPFTDKDREELERILKIPVGEPYGLLHKANPPGRNAVMGLAAYPRNMGTWWRLVGSLRNSGYDGHIIFGVHKDIPQDEQEYLKEMDVTTYIVDMVDCDASVGAGETRGGSAAVRNKCARGLEKLNLEWGRYEMARQWLHACESCTGWSLVMDTRDVFFQADPFASLPPPIEAKEDLLFIEEIANQTSPKADPKRWYQIGTGRFKTRVGPCYGRDTFQAYFERPVLCSGTVIGTRSGMHRFLSVLVNEFYTNNQKEQQSCKSPQTTDQWTMNYLYYTGKFGEYDRTKTIPWGTGPVLTIGHPCINKNLPNPKHSQKDMIEFDDTGLILNNWENDDSKARIAPVVHQYDRCHRWVQKFFHDHGDIFNTKPTLAWK